MSQSLTYEEIISRLNKAGINDNPYQWYAFILGLMNRGFDPGQRHFIAAIATVFNDSQPLPGTITAALTSLGLELQLQFKQQPQRLLSFPDNPRHSELRLQALADLAYGLSVALVFDKNLGQINKIEDETLLDGLETLSKISQVDTQSQLDEEDLKEVLNYIQDLLINTQL